MNRNLTTALLLIGGLGSLAKTADAQTNPLFLPPLGHGAQDWPILCDVVLPLKPLTTIYSPDYGVQYQYDSLFGAVMGFSGTVAYSKYCLPPNGATLPVAGRVGFFIGADPTTTLGGSTQDNTPGNQAGVDDGMGLTMGTYTGVASTTLPSQKFFCRQRDRREHPESIFWAKRD